MTEIDDKLRNELVIALLEYIGNKRTLDSVLTISADKGNSIRNQNLMEAVNELNSIGSQIKNGREYSKESLADIFTSMVERLT